MAKRIRTEKDRQRARDRDRLRKRPHRTCPVCGKSYAPTCGDQKYCSRRCGGIANRKRWPSSKIHPKTCAWCGVAFIARQSSTRYCSGQCWYRANYDERRAEWIARAHRRHAQLKELEREDVDPLRIYERDKWTCQLCGKKVRRTPRRKHDPLMASLDHIIPVTKGGGWTYANLHTAHLRCNKSKGNRGGGEQLRLVG